MSRKGKRKSKRRRIIARNERYHRDLYPKKNIRPVKSKKKYVKCSKCGKNLPNSSIFLRFSLGSAIVCDECFIKYGNKVKKW